jgi:transposase-like protein
MSNKIVSFDEAAIKKDLSELARQTVQETLNAMISEEADRLIEADRYERTETRKGYRSGSYERGFTTTAGKVTLSVPKLKDSPSRPLP